MVDLGGYIIILMNDNGKIKLYGSSADNADNPEVGDEILEVNGRTLENATDAEVSQYIHQCIKSGTISLQVTRRTGNKMKELDGPNADRIKDAWVIALERGARERLQKLPALRKIQPRDIQAILHQQITDGSASTSTNEKPKKDVTNSHITVTLAEQIKPNCTTRLSNGTVLKPVTKQDDEVKDRKDLLDRQRSCPEESNLLQPVASVRSGERRSSSPFQNGRTEVLIGEPEGTPRSPRGSTSSATNDANLLISPGDSDHPESIYKSRRRSNSDVGDIHLQPSQLQENNNGVSGDIGKGGGGVDSRDPRVDITSGPNEMWPPGSSPGYNRELPVDVPDSLLQQAYANKQVMSLMLNRSETTFSSSTSSSQKYRLVSDDNNDNSVGKRSASDHEIFDNSHRHLHHLHHHHQQQKAHNKHRHQSNIPSLNAKKNANSTEANDIFKDKPIERSFDEIDNRQAKVSIDETDDNENLSDNSKTLARIIEINAKNDSDVKKSLANKMMDDNLKTSKMATENSSKVANTDKDDSDSNMIDLEVIRPFAFTDDCELSSEKEEIISRNGVTPAILLTKESSVDPDEDYPFAKEDYPTMLKTCSDDSASPRSSSGRSDSTAPLDASLSMTGKESPLYDARRIDLGSPCRSLVTDMKVAPLFTRGRETTSFDNPAYGLSTDLHDLYQGLLMRSDEVNDLTRLIDEQHVANGRKTSTNKTWTPKEQPSNRQSVKTEMVLPSGSPRGKKKSLLIKDLERIKTRGNRDSDCEIDSEGLLGAGSTDDLLSSQLSNLTITRSTRRKKGQQVQSSTGYSSLRSDGSIGDFPDQGPYAKDRSFLVVGNRSYREVAVDCPADFIPVTKSHPVYPPPNKSDTIERNQSKDKRSTIDDRTKRMSSFSPDYETLDLAIESNETDNKSSKDSASTLERNSRPKAQDKTANDASSAGQGELLKSDDNRNVVNDLSGNRDGPREKPGLNGVKPAIPPRDQKRAPARPPKDSVILTPRNNNIEQVDYANTPEPTQQQLHSIRKYQEQFRKRKEEDERQEYLNHSVRSSKKLQALESHATNLAGQENLAYAQDEVATTPRSSHSTSGHPTSRDVTEEPPKVLTYGEVVATLERLQLQLKSLSGALGISGPGVEAELEAVRTLLVQKRFATALATHQALKTRLRTGKPLKYHDDDASNIARDVVEVLEEWQTKSVGGNETRAMVEELTNLLTSYEIEGLLLAHDSIISYVDGIQRKTSSSSSSPSRTPSPNSSLYGTRNADNIKIIRIEKTNEPLGATVRNEGDAVIIGRVVRGGAADKSGLFHEGDEVLEVNGVEMRGKSVNEVCDILAGMQGGLTFLVLPASTNQRNNVSNARREDTTQIQHVRAHFDYDPEEDPYIPCRELGVSFQKGDVLHVISQEDSNWWQAYREGEEDHTLAGLIPSRAFQHQRESMKQTFAGGKSSMRSSKKSSTLLCTRKNPKKKKKRTKFGLNYNDEGYPLYATTTIDDYDSEEVLTYEEVALYYPRANHKRPIVLIGPPNIGRHELRQRLMQDSERFAAAIPHTSRPRKGSEVDGQDYHFISRSQFESDILGRKFVEHGEYEKAYYGTSVEAIRTVVNSGKICVLNLHPQSLKILRSSDLKPYVVFVAPPSLEKLRQKRIKNNESFKEEELKDIIEKAREMEDKYGHLFDMIILNNDTDRAYNQLLGEINSLEREPQWVPASWVQ